MSKDDCKTPGCKKKKKKSKKNKKSEKSVKKDEPKIRSY